MPLKIDARVQQDRYSSTGPTLKRHLVARRRCGVNDRRTLRSQGGSDADHILVFKIMKVFGRTKKLYQSIVYEHMYAIAREVYIRIRKEVQERPTYALEI